MNDESAIAESAIAESAIPHLPADLRARLWQLGGAWTGAVSQWGSYEILTPAGAAEKYYWCTPDALASLLDEWAADPAVGGRRLALEFALLSGLVWPGGPCRADDR